MVDSKENYKFDLGVKGLIMYMKKIMCIRLAENECVLMKHNCKVVTRMQSINSAQTFSILSVLTFCDVFSCTLLTSNNMISLAIWCYMKFVNWSRTANCSRNFVVFGKFTCAWKHQIALRIVSLPY